MGISIEISGVQVSIKFIEKLNQAVCFCPECGKIITANEFGRGAAYAIDAAFRHLRIHMDLWHEFEYCPDHHERETAI